MPVRRTFPEAMSAMDSNAFYLNDVGIETELIYKKGVDLECFAAFPLLKTEEGKELLFSFEEDCLLLAKKFKLPGFVTWTRTWRANPDWAAKINIGGKELDEYNRVAVKQGIKLRKKYETDEFSVFVCGMMGPRKDGYVVQEGDRMTAGEAEEYHYNQIKVLAEAGVDYICYATTTYSDEAIGAVRAAKKVGVSVVVSFTVETDGKLPGGESIKEAVLKIEDATDKTPVHYGVNCAHPIHYLPVFEASEKEEWTLRFGEIKPNPSEKSHAELNQCTSLQRGDPEQFGKLCLRLKKVLPGLKVFGGCCGSDLEHLEQTAIHLLAL
jgi:S-methylmethionine-dependent homocysteine/selenocysteine methylase